MFTYTYQLNKNITGRVAHQLNYLLNDCPFIVRIYIKDNRQINGKSLLGLLSGDFHKGEDFTIGTINKEQLELVKEKISELEI